jgi:hypothetical protein
MALTIRQNVGGRSVAETVKPLAALIRFPSVVRTFFAIPGAFCFWKEVKTRIRLTEPRIQ